MMQHHHTVNVMRDDAGQLHHFLAEPGGPAQVDGPPSLAMGSFYDALAVGLQVDGIALMQTAPAIEAARSAWSDGWPVAYRNEDGEDLAGAPVLHLLPADVCMGALTVARAVIDGGTPSPEAVAAMRDHLASLGYPEPPTG